MNSNLPLKRQPNPWKSANICSKLFYFFAFRTLKKGFETELQEKDVYQPLEIFDSGTLGPLLETLWEREKQKSKPHIVFPLFKLFGANVFMFGGAYLLVDSIVLVATPLLKGKVVSYFAANQTDLSKAEAYYYAFALLFFTFVNTTFTHWYHFSIERVSLRIQISICALLYRKTLRLDSFLTSEAANGQLVTLITKDVYSLDHGIFLMNRLWVGIIQVSAMMYLMYLQIGLSAIIGGSLLLVTIPLQAYLGYITSNYRKKSAEKTDERIEITQEVLTAMKIIKMFTWEKLFSKRVGDIRNFTFQTFKKGFETELQEKDVYQPLEMFDSGTLGPLLETEWEREKQNSKPHIVFPLFKLFGPNIFMFGCAYLFVNSSVLVATPLLKGKVVSYFAANQTDLSKAEAYYYAFALLFFTFVNTIFTHWYIFSIERIRLRIQISLCALLYRKTLRLDSFLTSETANGQLVTLITKDVYSLNHVIHLINKLWVGIIQVSVMIYLMYLQIGVSAIIGGSLLLVTIPLQAYLGYITSKYRKKSVENTDERIKITQEVLIAIKIIKMFTWEKLFSKRVGDIRKKEIQSLKMLLYIRNIIEVIGHLNYRVALFICIISYVSLGNHVTAQQAFTVIGYFTVLRMVISTYLPNSICYGMEINVSLKRITNFMLLEEISKPKSKDLNSNFIVEIKNASVISETNEPVLRDVSLKLQNGLTVLTGPLGSGKSTLFKLILGEVQRSGGTVETPPRVSLATQEPWLFPATIRQNIVFNNAFDEKRYNSVVDVCALRRDFEELPCGDTTILTDKGLNLSRGQKTRINMARAVYARAEVYLFDDCLSSIDSQVSKQIFRDCVKTFLKDKILLLVTSHNNYLQEADSIIILNAGNITFQGSFDKLQESKTNFDTTLTEHTDIVCLKEAVTADLKEDSELAPLLSCKGESNETNIYKEEQETGFVKKEVYYRYAKAGGGLKLLIGILIICIGTQIMESWSDYFVSYWVDYEQELSGFRTNGTTHTVEFLDLKHSYQNMLKLYLLVICLAIIFTVLRSFIFYIFTSNASVNIHNSILEKIVYAQMIFFDMNLSGSVLNRFSRDLGIIDEVLPMSLFECFLGLLVLCGTLYVVTSVHLIFLLFSAIFITLLIIARYLFLPTARSIRRLEGSTRSPVIGHISATLDGLLTIRSNQAQNVIIEEFDKHLNLYNSCMFMHFFTTRAFGFYLDILCALYISAITLTFLTYKADTLVGKVGLAISQAFSLTGTVQWLVRQWADLENHMTSVERVSEYDNIASETKHGISPPSWPNQGEIVYNNVSLRYFENSELVLDGITFTIQPRHKIGIVGRTGAGKSSVVSTLFKMYKFEGNILIDGIDINTISIEHLRSQMSIIPQDPVLFSGTIRTNLDPFNRHTDKVLWSALEDVGLKTAITNLNLSIGADGSTFSTGQKQLLSLARAILSSNNILVLDEATANIDPNTDLFIQKIIKKKFEQCTIITIAHKLNTIMNSDRILVLDSGKIIEYDDPEKLLENKNSTFNKIVNDFYS